MTAELDRAIHEDVVLVPHDPAWAARFEAEKERLCALFPSAFAGVEHVGSTAVAGMRGVRSLRGSS